MVSSPSKVKSVKDATPIGTKVALSSTGDFKILTPNYS